MFPITGDTYEIRDRLKSLGCTWDDAERRWVAPDEGIRSQGQTMADAEPVRKWRLFADNLPWAKGSLSSSTYEAALRAASLGVAVDEVLRLAEERIAAAGSPVKGDKISRDVKRGYDFAQSQKGEHPTSNTQHPTSNLQKPKKKAEFAVSKLKGFAAAWRDVVDIAWLADRSAIDPVGLDAAGFLAALYREWEKVLVLDVFASQGQWVFEKGEFVPSVLDYAAWDGNDRKHETPPALKRGEEFTARGPSGIWFLSNPIDGSFHMTNETDKWERPKWSRRAQPSITDWRYFVIESDQADLRDWTAAMVQLPMPIAAIYTSAGASVHVLVKVDGTSKAEIDLWRETALRVLPVLGGDPGVMTAVRLTRLPGCVRLADKDGNAYPRPREQRLLYLNPNPGDGKIVDMAPVRDSVGPWIRLAESLCGTLEDEVDREDVRKVLAGLGRFSNVPKARAAASEVRRWWGHETVNHQEAIEV